MSVELFNTNTIILTEENLYKKTEMKLLGGFLSLFLNKKAPVGNKLTRNWKFYPKTTTYIHFRCKAYCSTHSG